MGFATWLGRNEGLGVLCAVLLACSASPTPIEPTGPTGPLPAGRVCEVDADCQSGACVELPAGRACASLCAGECTGGYVCKRRDGRDPESPSICVPPQSRVCLPCAVDQDCGDYGDLCLAFDGGLFCGLDCSETGGCPDGYACLSERNEAGAELSRQCRPESGTCTCSDENAGLERPCEKTVAAIGTCVGEEVCLPGTGWVSCDARTPLPELCDRLDNDCDGSTDEATDGSPLRRPCGYGDEPRRSECVGEESCNNGVFGACSLPPRPTDEEECDGYDDDCDGSVDEGLVTSPDDCGACGNICPPGSALDASTVRSCVAGALASYCGPIACRVPSFDVDGDEDNGCEVEDDHQMNGTAVVLNNTWGASLGLTNNLSCDDGVWQATCEHRLPTDLRQHVPTTPPNPNVDFHRFFADDTLSCEPETWVCALFGGTASEGGPYGGEVELCVSTPVADTVTAPTFPGAQCVTIDLGATNWDAVPAPNDDGGYFYVRLRNVSGRYGGNYAVAAYDFDLDPFEAGRDACPLGLPVDPCFY